MNCILMEHVQASNCTSQWQAHLEHFGIAIGSRQLLMFFLVGEDAVMKSLQIFYQMGL